MSKSFFNKIAAFALTGILCSLSVRDAGAANTNTLPNIVGAMLPIVNTNGSTFGNTLSLEGSDGDGIYIGDYDTNYLNVSFLIQYFDLTTNILNTLYTFAGYPQDVNYGIDQMPNFGVIVTNSTSIRVVITAMETNGAMTSSQFSETYNLTNKSLTLSGPFQNMLASISNNTALTTFTNLFTNHNSADLMLDAILHDITATEKLSQAAKTAANASLVNYLTNTIQTISTNHSNRFKPLTPAGFTTTFSNGIETLDFIYSNSSPELVMTWPLATDIAVASNLDVRSPMLPNGFSHIVLPGDVMTNSFQVRSNRAAGFTKLTAESLVALNATNFLSGYTNTPPVITAPASITIKTNSVNFQGISTADTDPDCYLQMTCMRYDFNGSSALIGGSTNVLQGTPAQVNAQLADPASIQPVTSGTVSGRIDIRVSDGRKSSVVSVPVTQ